MSCFASGVTVVTANYQDTLYGLTVSSFTSLSLEPRLILVCIDQNTRNYHALTGAGHFGVNILASDQEHLSRHFAGANKDDWSQLAYRIGQTGAPLLEGALVGLECAVHSLLPGGDHTVVVGEIRSISIEDKEPLVYCRASYHQLQPRI